MLAWREERGERREERGEKRREERGERREEVERGRRGKKGGKKEGDEVRSIWYITECICMSPVHETSSSTRDGQEGCD